MNNQPLDLPEHFERVNVAYTTQAPLFDRIQNSNEILQWMRSRVHSAVEHYLRPGDRMLDINAGTGIDAEYFALKGHSVTAVDVAEGMVHQIRMKIERGALHRFLSVRQCSYTDVGKLYPEKFDHVLSNFGGLNCLSDLRSVAGQLMKILNPGAFLTLVIMPPVCPWEILHAVKGSFRLAFRRLHKKGIMARVEGHYFKAYYHTPEDVLRAFGERFTLVKLSGLASFVPPPYMEKFPQMFPRLFTVLKKLDERFSSFLPVNRWADQYIITLRYNPR